MEINKKTIIIGVLLIWVDSVHIQVYIQNQISFEAADTINKKSVLRTFKKDI